MLLFDSKVSRSERTILMTFTLQANEKQIPYRNKLGISFHIKRSNARARNF